VLSSLWYDVAYGYRSLAKRPALTVTAIVTLALGIGANTAVFSVVDAIMLRPLPVPDARRLVSIVSKKINDVQMQPVPFPDYLENRELSDVFVDVTAFSTPTVQLSAGDYPERALITLTTGNYFSTLGLDAEVGRVYGEAEGDIGGDSVVVLDYRYWKGRFGGDPSIVGRTLTINRHPATVIGVTPASFQGTVGLVRPTAYVPFSTWEGVDPSLRQVPENHRSTWLVVGRLRDGVSIEDAQAAVMAVAARLEREYPVTNAHRRFFVFPEPLTRSAPDSASVLKRVAAVMMIMVSLVLLIACTNVANMLLARAAERRREIAVRSALGAGRLRIARQLLIESGILSVGGGIAGLIVAGLVTRLLTSIPLATDLEIVLDVSVDLRVLGFVALVAIAAALLAGLAPALHAARSNLAEALKEGGRAVASGGRRLRLRDLLVIGQVAVSLVLLVGTVLLVRSMVNLSRFDFGFETRDRLVVTVNLLDLEYDLQQRREFFRELLERVRSLPGVLSAATSTHEPMGLAKMVFRVFPQDDSVGPGDARETRRAWCNIIGPGYFNTMGIELLDGRDFDEDDTPTTRAVAIINSTTALEFWPGQDPIGRRFAREAADGLLSDIEVVGVVKTAVWDSPGEPPEPGFYLSALQLNPAIRVITVHAVSDPVRIAPAVRSEIRALDPDTPIYDVRTMEAVIAGSRAMALIRLPARVIGISAAIGLTLAALGLYAVIAYSISSRSHEIGVRLAAGANPSDIVRLVLSKGLLLGGVGIAVGMLLARLITGRFAFLLTGVGPGDPPTYIAVSMLVLLIAVVASYIPARFRAARIDPAVALREE
jgi:putative ABC transport system permease protein